MNATQRVVRALIVALGATADEVEPTFQLLSSMYGGRIPDTVDGVLAQVRDAIILVRLDKECGTQQSER